jgi:hypothetical protein
MTSFVGVLDDHSSYYVYHGVPNSLENLALIIELEGMTAKESQQLVTTALQFLQDDTPDRLHSMVTSLSEELGVFK